MRFTLLDMTQNILSALGSDEVNSISDTTEAMQVAQIIKNKYYDIVSRGELPEHFELFQLDPPLDSTNPVLMYIPDGISKLEYLKYFDTNTGIDTNTTQHGINTDLPVQTPVWFANSTTSITVGVGMKTFTIDSDELNIYPGDSCIAASGANMLFGVVEDYTGFDLTINVLNKIGRGTFNDWSIYKNDSMNPPPGYQYVTILPIQQFIDHVNQFNPYEEDTQSFIFTDSYNSVNNNFTFYFKNRQQPKYCTVISNYYVIFDAYDLTQDVTLQASKTLAYGQVIPTFDMEDDFIPDLDDQQFPLLVNEAKSLAFFELKQQTHTKADQEIKRQWSTVQKNKSIANKPSYFDQLPNFGRYGGINWKNHRFS